jgi:F-type H+-transporting ATPase subunit 8
MQRQFFNNKHNYFLFIRDPYIFHKILMPQLIPFYYVNQFSFSFLTLLSLIYMFSKYILPLFTFQQVIRMYITKLSNK